MRGAVGTNEPRVAIVHDALVNAGGAERVAAFLCEAFPQAPLYTSVYLPDRTYADFRGRAIRTLPGARWASTEARAKQMLPIWLLGFRRLRLDQYDIVLSSTTFGAKQIQPPTNVRHVSYMYAPFRWLWTPQVYDASSLPVAPLARGPAALLRPFLRRADYAATSRISSIATTCR